MIKEDLFWPLIHMIDKVEASTISRLEIRSAVSKKFSKFKLVIETISFKTFLKFKISCIGKNLNYELFFIG